MNTKLIDVLITEVGMRDGLQSVPSIMPQLADAAQVVQYAITA